MNRLNCTLFSGNMAKYLFVVVFLAFQPLTQAQIGYQSIYRFIGGSDSSGLGDNASLFDSSIRASGTNGSIEVSQRSSCAPAIISGTFGDHIHGATRNFEYALNDFVVQFTVPTDSPYRLKAWTAGVFTNTVSVVEDWVGLGWRLDNVNVPGLMMGCFCVTNFEQLGVLSSNTTHTLEVHNNFSFRCGTISSSMYFDSTNIFGFCLTLLPALNVRSTDSGLTLEWPAYYGTNFVLERTMGTVPPWTWVTTTNLTEQTNGLLSVTLNPSEESGCFRLKGQGF